jgi:hypothetical protein
MACDVRVSLTAETRQKAKEGLAELARRLASKAASIVIDKATGAMAIRGWRSSDVGMSDACVLRRISTSPETRGAYLAAVRDAERVAGRSASRTAQAAGVHSHDGGNTWGPGH